jgi:glutaminyl-tRNA synthetase
MKTDDEAHMSEWENGADDWEGADAASKAAALEVTTGDTPAGRDFIREIIQEDLRTGKHAGRVATRFPPEPNGYLHIGHAKAICIDFGVAREFGGTCNLRYDDTNPVTEDVEFVDSIEQDIRWLGFEWDAMHYASDYFERLYEFAEVLIRKGLAYVDSLPEDQIREYRGNFYKKGVPSPFRDRSVDENLDLFRRMRAGEFPDGAHVLRARIDLDSQNMNMRDPLIYRIKHAHHHRTGDAWCIYPMYDFAHPLSDAIENITYSLCTLEFEAHRPLYDWFVRECEAFPSRQIEFARLNLTYTVLSKRKLLRVVNDGLVNGWDDPRMPTLAGLRRRGFSATAIRAFCDRIGVAKNDSLVDVALLEHTLREDLNATSPRVMGVLNPLRLVIDNFPEGQVEWLDAPWHPERPDEGGRKVPFSRVLYVEQDDFREDPPKQWHRLAPGREVRLRYACLVTCTGVVKDPATGAVVELHATWDPQSRGGTAPDGRRVPGTIHWVSAEHAVDTEVRLYDRLFSKENPGDVEEGKDFLAYLNPGSLEVRAGCKVESSMSDVPALHRVQFERLGYFCADPDSRPGAPVFNRTVTLRDSWAKLEAKMQGGAGAGRGGSGTEPSSGAAGVSDPGRVEVLEPRSDLKPMAPEITIDDFVRIDLRVGTVREAGLVDGAKKLIRLGIDLGEGRLRQVFAGVRAAYPDPAVLVGKQVIVVANLKPREMKFGTSEGMVLAGGDGNDVFVATFEGSLKPGDPVT